MARRRRLEPPSSDAVASIRADAAEGVATRSGFDLMAAPAIAQVAADSVAAQRDEIDALRAAAGRHAADAARLRAAEAQGLLLTDAALDDIDVDYLSRDRMPRVAEGEEWRALKASIQTHGQRTPIELAALAEDGRPRWGLISGYRRVAALRRLFEETGEARFSRAKAVVRSRATLGQAFVAMVEENEVRAALSYFERGRVCMLAAQQGAFATPGDALDALFASASPAKRSKIRSFMRIVEELGDLLARPEAIGERLGLRLAQALKDGQGGRLRRDLGRAAEDSRADEGAVLTQALAALRARAPQAPGPEVSVRQSGERTLFVVRGVALTADQVEALAAALRRALAEAAPGAQARPGVP